VTPAHRLIVEAQALHGPGRKIFDHHVSPGDEALGQLAALGRLQVEGDAELGGIEVVHPMAAVESGTVVLERLQRAYVIDAC
jgi:hypothetical protein